MKLDLEWFPLYVGRFLNSRRLRRFNAERIGIYLLLIMEQWEGGPLPPDEEELAFLGRCRPSEALAVLEACFDLTEDGWICPELEVIRAEQTEKHNQRVEAGRLGGLAKSKRSSSTDLPYKPSIALPLDKNRGEVREEDKEPPPTPPEAFLRDFEEFWSAYPLKIGKKKALKAYQARRRQKTEHADIMAGLVRYLHWAEATDTKLKHAATFVGPDEHWKETWTVTDADTAKKGNGQPPGFAESRFQKEFVPDIRPRPDKVPGWATDTVLEAPNVEMPTKKPDPAQTAAAVEEQKRKLAELVRDQ